MPAVRKLLPRYRLAALFLVLALPILTAAQSKDNDNDRDRDRDRTENGSNRPLAGGGLNLMKLEGEVRCEKPAPEYSIEVSDRPGHVLTIAERKCAWIQPMIIMGAKTKDGVAVSFTEKMEGTLHVHEFETFTFDNGEKLTWQTMGQVLAEKGPVDSTGRWSLMRGTGKFNGIKGGGTYAGKLDTNNVLILDFDGVFDSTEMPGENK